MPLHAVTKKLNNMTLFPQSTASFFVEMSWLGPPGPSFTGLVIEGSFPHRWSAFKASRNFCQVQCETEQQRETRITCICECPISLSRSFADSTDIAALIFNSCMKTLEIILLIRIFTFCTWSAIGNGALGKICTACSFLVRMGVSTAEIC